MIIYEDIFTDHELFSDAYPTKLIDDLFYEAEGATININNSVDDALLGGNASAEGGDEGAEDAVVTEINLIYAFKLKKYELDVKAYKKHIMAYGKKLVDKQKAADIPADELTSFKAKLQKKVGDIIKNFKDYDVYINEDYNEEGMMCLLNYRADGVTPFFTYFATGVRGVKC